MPRKTEVRWRNGTASQWTTANPILALGEAGYEKDTGKIKVGDGATVWASLPYRFDVAGSAPLASPTFTGTPAAPTAAPGTDTTQLATTAFVKAANDAQTVIATQISDSTSVGRSVLTAASQAAARSAIGVGAGTGDLVAANNLSDIASAATARTNLGLGNVPNVNSQDAANLTSGTIAADRMPAHTGDVTSPAGAVALTIANGAVTYAKMQDISATARVLGRKTAGAGDVEEMTLSETLDLIGSAAHGDILYRGASAWQRLAAGVSGYFLRTLGAGVNPEWAASTNKLVELLNTTLGAPAAQVEQTWTAGAYSKIIVIMSDCTASANSTILVTLRHSGGAILTHTIDTDGSGGLISSALPVTYEGEFIIGLTSATKYHASRSMATQVSSAGSASNATAPDRIRVARSTGNLGTGTKVQILGVPA